MAATRDSRRETILSVLPGEERVRLACELTDLCFSVTRSGIAAQHPDWGQREIVEELVRRLNYRAHEHGERSRDGLRGT